MSWRDTALALAARGVAKPLLSLPLPWHVHRRALRFAEQQRPDEDITFVTTEIAGVPCGIVTPRTHHGTLLWLHGGGFVLGSARSYLPLASALARQSGRRVILPDYRLAPEHPFPAAPDDCLAVARELATQGPFALGGDSAGGCLAAAVLADLLRDGTPPTRLVLASPAADLDPARPTPDMRGEILFPKSLLYRMAGEYAGTADPLDPRLSPIHGSYPGAPPTLIQCARGEVLEGDADALADCFRAGGGSVEVEKTDGVPHDWQLFVGHTPKADRAVVRMTDFLRVDP